MHHNDDADAAAPALLVSEQILKELSFTNRVSIACRRTLAGGKNANGEARIVWRNPCGPLVGVQLLRDIHQQKIASRKKIGTNVPVPFFNPGIVRNFNCCQVGASSR